MTGRLPGFGSSGTDDSPPSLGEAYEASDSSVTLGYTKSNIFLVLYEG